MAQQIEVPGMGIVEFPDGMSDADIATAIRRSMPPKQEPAINPLDDMSGTQKFLAGAGKAFTDIYRGGKQLLNIGDQQKLQQEIDEDKRLSAPLMDSGAGIAGNVVGNLAVTAPLAMIPGGATIRGGIAAGAASGLTQPVATGESRTQNAIVGGVVGGAVPTAIRAAKILRAGAVDPFTSAGQTKIAGNVINRAAADPAAVVQRLKTNKGSTPGFKPTVGQAASDEGVAALERTVRQSDPKAFDAINKEQRGALVEALRSIAGTPEARKKQSDLVEETAKKLYGEALKEDFFVTPELAKLANRPSMRSAEARAKKLAAEHSAPFQAALDDLRPKDIPIDNPLVQSASVSKPVNPYTNPAPVTETTEELIPRTSYFELPPVESVPVRDLHTLKMGMDAMMADPTLGIAGREAKAINATRNRLLDMLPESYQKARQAHIELNKPIHQMDIGKELYNRFTPALADQGDLPFKNTAQSYAKALREGDDLAKNVTGMKNAKIADIMTPEQMQLLEGVAKDSALKAAAEDIGRGAGSDTFQKLSMNNIIAKAELPKFVETLVKVPSGWAKRAGDVFYGSSDDAIRARLAELLRNPEEAFVAMQAAGATPSQISGMLKKAAQGAALSLPPAVQARE